MKARRSNRKITPFGGAIPVLKQIRDFKIPELIRECLGTRVKQAKYGYDDAIISWMLTNLCGGRRLDHMRKMKKTMEIIPDLNLPSPVTVGRLMKTLATEIITTKSVTRNRLARETFSEINYNPNLSNLLLRATKQVGILKENTPYTLDVDAVFIETDNFEAKYNKLHGAYGFYPMVALIGDLPVFIEMRNGNVAPQYEQQKFIQKCIETLAEHNIKVARVRADSASYDKNMMEYLDSIGVQFCIKTSFPNPLINKKTGAPSESQPIMHNAIMSCDNYKQIELKTGNTVWNFEIGDVDYTLYKSEHTFRLIIARIPNVDNPNHQRIENLRKKRIVRSYCGRKMRGWKLLNGYWHKTIISNDFSSTAEELMVEYFQRGDSERNFDFLKNGCSWNLPPFSSFTHNSVFLHIAALTNNIYRGILEIIGEEVDEISRKTQVTTFTFIFMAVACELVGQTYVFYDTEVPYEKFC